MPTSTSRDCWDSSSPWSLVKLPARVHEGGRRQARPLVGADATATPLPTPLSLMLSLAAAATEDGALERFMRGLPMSLSSLAVIVLLLLLLLLLLLVIVVAAAAAAAAAAESGFGADTAAVRCWCCFSLLLPMLLLLLLLLLTAFNLVTHAGRCSRYCAVLPLLHLLLQMVLGSRCRPLCLPLPSLRIYSPAHATDLSLAKLDFPQLASPDVKRNANGGAAVRCWTQSTVRDGNRLIPEYNGNVLNCYAGRGRMTIGPMIPTMPEGSNVGVLTGPGRQQHQARRAVRYSASRMR